MTYFCFIIFLYREHVQTAKFAVLNGKKNYTKLERSFFSLIKHDTLEPEIWQICE